MPAWPSSAWCSRRSDASKGDDRRGCPPSSMTALGRWRRERSPYRSPDGSTPAGRRGRVGWRDRYYEGVAVRSLRSAVPDGASRAKPMAVETKLFRGLADPARLRILLAVRTGSRSAGELAALLDLSPSNTSNHLLCLLECGLLKVASSGRSNLYSLADPAVDRLLDAGSALIDVVGPAVEECLNYGPPSRRALRPSRPRLATRPAGRASTGAAERRTTRPSQPAERKAANRSRRSSR